MILPDRLCAITVTCVLLLACGESGSEVTSPSAGVDQLERGLELQHHEGLLARMASPAAALSAFTTDGCSGGLSIGWEYLSGRIERIQELHGARPPWEDCCVAHDRLYHAGPDRDADSAASFAARKAADLALQACVLETGRGRAPELSIEYDVSAETVGTLYAAIAELMYRAVRVGGMPCSGLSWRWGYGWPECG